MGARAGAFDTAASTRRWSRFSRSCQARTVVRLAAARFDEAGWVGWQLAAVLPVANAAKQHWLELRDPLERLAAIPEELTRLAGPGRAIAADTDRWPVTDRRNCPFPDRRSG
ncbi:MAG: hypothetical protein MZV65_21330 [Chromatiales bacterium]|nr:hypothetical protein [Chromatiales bacterium]